MTASEPAPLPVTPAGVRAPRARFQRSPAVVILLVSALVAIPLVVLSFVDAAGLRSLWDELHWIVSAVGAAIATTVSVQRADGRVRAVRAAGAMAFLLWMIATLLWASRDLLRMGGEP
ncbi:MAG TPA: hypothetical protein VFY18_13025, partial [Candidatus Limnocylindrales bacterium]|nr:hypothetical protein [Candidatus Limnocylindrales bacterium]